MYSYMYMYIFNSFIHINYNINIRTASTFPTIFKQYYNLFMYNNIIISLYLLFKIMSTTVTLLKFFYPNKKI